MVDARTSNPLQFRLRHLLVAMLAIAVVSAVVAPWIRDLSRGQWLRLGLTISLAVGSFGAIFLLLANLYIRRRRRLGTIQYDLRGTWRWQIRWLGYIPLTLAALLGVALAWFEWSRPSDQPNDIIRLTYSCNIGFLLANGFFWLRCPVDRVLLGENGALVSNYFFPWDKVWYSWAKNAQPTPIALTTASMARYYLEVPPQLEESIALFLQSRARDWDHPRQPS